MPYYIDIECNACHSKFKIDAANYANKKISFICKNCGNKISYFVPPGIDGLYAPKAEISTQKVKKVKEENKKGKNENLNPVKSASSVTTDKLKLKLPSLFKRKADTDQIDEEPAQTSGKEFTIDPLVSKIAAESKKQSHQTTRKIPSENEVKNVEKEARPFPVIGPSEERFLTQNGSGKPLDFLSRDAGKALPSEAESADFQPVKPRMNVRASATNPELNNASEKSMVHVPKPGMPFIAQLSTPSFYKAGSARRKDYSFIVTEISRFRTALGRTGISDPLSTNKMADVNANDQDFSEPEFTPVNESAAVTPFVIEKQPESSLPPTPPLVYTQPTSADIEKEAIEFERNIRDEIKYSLPPRVEEEDREMEFIIPISPYESPAAVKPSISTNNSKIYIPLSRDINPDPERSSGVAGSGSASAAINNPENDDLITPEIDVIEDSYTSGVPPAPGQPGFQMEIPQIPTPFAGYEQRPFTDSRALPLNGVVVAPQPYPVEDQQGFSAPAVIPSYPPLQQPYQQTPPPIPHFMGQEREVAPQPQVPFYDLRPAVPSAPSVPQPQGPFAQMPPAPPIPPPSVTSPPPTGTQKKPAIIDEDEEEQFGPSNFGLDF